MRQNKGKSTCSWRWNWYCTNFTMHTGNVWVRSWHINGSQCSIGRFQDRILRPFRNWC